MEYIDYSKYFTTYTPFVEEKKDKTTVDFADIRSNLDWNIPVYDFEYNSSETKSKIFDDLFDRNTNNSTNSSNPTSADTLQIGNFNTDAAAKELHKNCNYQLRSGQSRITQSNENQFSKKDPNKSGHYCGTSVRLALEAGGLGRIGANVGGSFGPVLLKHGWKEIPLTSEPQKGDIAVTTPFGTHKNGHVSMYDGTQWVSDFVQKSMFVFNSAKNHTKIYRYQG